MDLAELTDNENRHPWELSRAQNILRLLNQSADTRKPLQIADIGAGDCYFSRLLLKQLKQKGSTAKIFAVDQAFNSIESDDPQLVLLRDLQELDDQSMDCIIMMDVLEHIENDREFLEIVRLKLKTDGLLLITVPAFNALYSSHDKFLKHFRRYQINDLKHLLRQSQFQITRSHYFYFCLVSARWLQMQIQKILPPSSQQGIGGWKHPEHTMITVIIRGILNLDYRLCAGLNRLGIHLPGLSLLAVAHPSILR